MLTVCVIAKNEAHHLPRLIESLTGVSEITEICVLDTGSTDGTEQVARSLGARVDRWEGGNDHTGNLANFAEARNRNLDMAQTPWILMMDADDVLHRTPSAPPLPEWLREEETRNPHLMTVMFPIRMEDRSEFWQARILRTGIVRYVGRIHEYPHPSWPRAQWAHWQVEHRPNKTGKENSDERVFRILHAVPPHVRTEREWFYLARSYWSSGQYGAAIAGFEEYFRRNPSFQEETVFARYYLAQSYRGLQDLEGAKRQIGIAISIDPRFAELHCYLGDLFYLQGNFARALTCYEFALQLAAPPPDSVLFVDPSKYGPYPRSMRDRISDPNKKHLV